MKKFLRSQLGIFILLLLSFFIAGGAVTLIIFHPIFIVGVFGLLLLWLTWYLAGQFKDALDSDLTWKEYFLRF